MSSEPCWSSTSSKLKPECSTTGAIGGGADVVWYGVFDDLGNNYIENEGEATHK